MNKTKQKQLPVFLVPFSGCFSRLLFLHFLFIFQTCRIWPLFSSFAPFSFTFLISPFSPLSRHTQFKQRECLEALLCLLSSKRVQSFSFHFVVFQEFNFLLFFLFSFFIYFNKNHKKNLFKKLKKTIFLSKTWFTKAKQQQISFEWTKKRKGKEKSKDQGEIGREK